MGRQTILAQQKKGQGFIYYENGDLDIVADKTSKEVVGRKITNESEPAKIIRAENGGIVLSAPYGTVTIVAANIRFVALDGTGGGEITFQASKLIHQDAQRSLHKEQIQQLQQQIMLQ